MLTYTCQAAILLTWRRNQNKLPCGLPPQDMEAIARIRELYGCISDSAAVRLALQMVARQETKPRTR